MSALFFCLQALLLVACAFIARLVYTYIRTFFWEPLHELPGQRLVDPVFGEVRAAVKRHGSLFDVGKLRRELYGKIRRVYLFWGQSRVELSDPRWVRYIMVENSKNYGRGCYAGVEHVQVFVGEKSLILIDGVKHRLLRRLATPAFKMSLLRNLTHIFQDCTDRICARWTRLCNGQVGPVQLQMRDQLSDLTLDIIGLAAFGVDFKSGEGDHPSSIAHAFHTLMQGGEISLAMAIPGFRYVYKLFRFLGNACPSWIPLPKRLAHLREILSLIRLVVTTGNQSERENLLNFMLQGNEKGALTYSELQDMICTILIAGHETSSLALCWALWELSKNPDIQDKCREEALHNFRVDANNNIIVTWDQIQDLSYCRAVIFETLRLYPSAPYLSRRTLTEDLVMGYKLPADTDLLLLVAEMHRDPDVWTNPDCFMPDRFLDENQVPWDAYIPFGDGVHKCIGYQLATAELVYVLAALVRSFRFSLVSGKENYVEKAIVTMSMRPNLQLGIELLT